MSYNIHLYDIYVIPVATNPSSQCSNEYLITGEEGYLASSKRTDYGAGTVHCPWKINSNLKKLNITLFKFISNPNSPLASSSSVCFEIGTIQNGGMSHGILTCGSDKTKGHPRDQGVRGQDPFQGQLFPQGSGSFPHPFQW